MKPNISFMIFLAVGLILGGCGQSVSKSFSDSSVANDPGNKKCLLEFVSERLCGHLDWTVGPTAEGASQLQVSFWDSQSGPVSTKDPAGELKVFLRMSCCGTVIVPKLVKTGVGLFELRDIHLVPGNWELHLQIRNGSGVEEKVEPINLNE